MASRLAVGAIKNAERAQVHASTFGRTGVVPSDGSSRTLVGIGVGGMGSLAVAAGLVALREELANVNVALVLVLIVLGAAALGGRTAGAMSGVVAATSFDFFHTRPYGSLKIARANDLVTTMLLLGVGLVMGEVAERSGRFKARLRDDQKELRRLHRVARLAASGAEDERDLVLTVTAELIDALRLRDCHFERPPFLSELPHLQADGAVSGRSRVFHSHGGFELPSAGVDLRVVGRKGVVGRFVLVPTPGALVSTERLLVAVALADELGLAFTAAAG